MKATEHIARAQELLERAEAFPATVDEQLPALRLAAAYALAHAQIARALQEQLRLEVEMQPRVRIEGERHGQA